MLRITTWSGVMVLTAGAVCAQALVMETVPVGNPANAGEWSGESYGGSGPDRICGAVDYAYHIGKYEVTHGQYCEFLNAAAADDTHGLYPGDILIDPFVYQIQRTGTPGSASYSVAPEWANRPVYLVSWKSAARFANRSASGRARRPCRT